MDQPPPQQQGEIVDVQSTPHDGDDTYRPFVVAEQLQTQQVGQPVRMVALCTGSGNVYTAPDGVQFQINGLDGMCKSFQVLSLSFVYVLVLVPGCTTLLRPFGMHNKQITTQVTISRPRVSRCKKV